MVLLLYVAVVSTLANFEPMPLSERKEYTLQQHVDNPYPSSKYM